MDKTIGHFDQVGQFDQVGYLDQIKMQIGRKCPYPPPQSPRLWTMPACACDQDYFWERFNLAIYILGPLKMLGFVNCSTFYKH